MADPAFDPNGAVRFDVKSGAASDARGTRLVLVPAAALEALERTTPGALAHLGSEVGRGCGARVAARLGGDAGVRAATLELVVSHLAGELAIAGLGAVHLERWGRAMVIVVSNPGVNSDGFLGAALSGALAAAAGRDVSIAPLGREGTTARYFVGTQQTAVKARSLVSQGKTWSDVLGALQKVT
ncbi:MAG: hypothetical protein KF894_12715 [Labilithrix sp.]|nr:hypothetical protein [Labilithrix sp.]